MLEKTVEVDVNQFLKRRRGWQYLPYRVWTRITNRIRNTWKAFTRACRYAYLGWNSPDWDYSFFLELLEFKLARMEKALWRNTEGEKKSKQALKLAVRLAKKLRKEVYSWHYSKHEKRWGPTTSEFIPCEDMPGYTTWKMTRAQVTDENRAQMEEELKQAFQLDADNQARDAAWLFGIIAKYYNSWWD